MAPSGETVKLSVRFDALLPEGLPALLEGPAPFGPFAGARVGFDLETWNFDSSYKGTYTAFGLGVEAGLKYFLDGRGGFYAEGVAGYMYYFPSTWKWTLDGTTTTWTSSGDPDFNPSRLTYGVSVGYAF